eukprot:CAMPEP_0170464052 /NCGR_PEP_ID=MMETSP0123-20130129/8925_1 /TAXON_ID=182087 /ORGANISM="Favella ehrenbergii, Strain Fehren 1" /LENGTH=45 /DNA_ID= /DNA_START= /DNA_END= /DNA_ORIENTATION=
MALWEARDGAAVNVCAPIHFIFIGELLVLLLGQNLYRLLEAEDFE